MDECQISLERENFQNLCLGYENLEEYNGASSISNGLFSSAYVWTLKEYASSFAREERRSSKCHQGYMDFHIGLRSREIVFDNGVKKDFYEVNLLVCAGIDNYFDSKNCFPGLRPNFHADIFIFSNNNKKFRMPNVDGQSLKFMMRKKLFKESVSGKAIVIGVNLRLIFPATIRNDGSKLHLRMYIAEKGEYGDIKWVKDTEGDKDCKLKPKDSEFLGEFPVHKHVLTAKSDVFSLMLQSNPQMKVIEVANATPEDLNNLIRFLYQGGGFAVGMSDKDFRNLYVIASKYKVVELVRICEKHILCRLTLDNAVETLKFARASRVKKIEDAVIAFLVKAKCFLSKSDIEALRDLDASLLVNIMWKISESQIETA